MYPKRMVKGIGNKHLQSFTEEGHEIRMLHAPFLKNSPELIVPYKINH